MLAASHRFSQSLTVVKVIGAAPSVRTIAPP